MPTLRPPLRPLERKLFMRNLSNILFLGLFVSILYFTLIFLAVNFAGLSFNDAIIDNPLVNNGESIFLGIISNIGIFLWILSFSLNLHAYVSNKKYIKIFLIGAIYSAFLLISDLFDFQNDFQNVVYFFLANSAFFVFFYSRKFSIIKNKLIILFVSFLFFSVAMLIDSFQVNINVLIPYLYTSTVEELFEFLGGFYYLFYWFEVFRKIYWLEK